MVAAGNGQIFKNWGETNGSKISIPSGTQRHWLGLGPLWSKTTWAEPREFLSAPPP